MFSKEVLNVSKSRTRGKDKWKKGEKGKGKAKDKASGGGPEAKGKPDVAYPKPGKDTKAPEKECGIHPKCTRVVPSWVVLADNFPTLTMFVLGTILICLVWWPFAVAYALYCGLSIVLFWGLICPYCHHYDTRACPCGYGVLAPKVFKPKEGRDFRAVFTQNIAIMFPTFFLPPVAGAVLLYFDFTYMVLGLLIAFAVVAFAIIPLISKFVGCKGCEIKDQCPWMT